MIGPKKVLTQAATALSPRALGPCHGTTGPSSIDPATGRPYGPSFPSFNFKDIVKAQHLLLQSLGVDKLVAVAGASLGGFQAFQWAVIYSDYMAGVIAMDTAPKNLFDSTITAASLLDDLSKDPK